MIDIAGIAPDLLRRTDGTWTSRKRRDVSYPSVGNDWCRELEDASFWFRHRNAVIVSLVDRLSPNGAIFDVGGGNGYVSRGLQRAGFESVLLEPGSGALHARSRGLDHVIHATLEDAGLRDGSVPSFGLFDVLEHIDDERRFLRRLHRSLAPGGRLYLTVPAYQGLWSRDDDFAGHFRRYTTNSLARALSESGFRVRYTTYMFAFLVPAIFALRAVPSWFGIRPAATLASSKREHREIGGIGGALLNGLLSRELRCIRSGGRVAIGSSCVAVAERACESAA